MCNAALLARAHACAGRAPKLREAPLAAGPDKTGRQNRPEKREKRAKGREGRACVCLCKGGGVEGGKAKRAPNVLQEAGGCRNLGGGCVEEPPLQ